jgi:gliding motility-associated-like protein
MPLIFLYKLTVERKMRKILLFVILACIANLANAQCPVVSGIFINACGTSSEGWNEYVVLKNGSTPTQASKITVATPNNAIVGYDTKANATALVHSVLDPVITSASCKSTGATPILIPIGPSDIIPASATIILFTGGKFEDYPYDFNSYCGSTVYVLISLRSSGPGSGSFSNTAARTSTITTTGCGTTHSYTYTTPPGSGSGGVDGAFAAFTSPDVTTLAAGNSGNGTSGVTAVNNGCSVPPPVVIPPPPPAAITKIIDTSSCHSIVFEGKTYTTSTTLDSTFKNVSGHDSVYRTVNITITPIIPSAKTININACSSVVFESKTYSSSTMLDSTFKSVGGCDSIYRTVNITITPITPLSKTIDTSSCHSIVFESKTYSSSTILDSTFKSVGGCDSIYRTVNITIVSIGASIKTIDTTGCGTIIFEGKTYTSSTVLDSTIKTIGGCDSIYRTVNINVLVPTNKTINISSCNSVVFEGNTYSSSIILDSTFKSVGGCDSIYRTVNITITPIAPLTKTIDTSSCTSIIFEGKTYSSSTTLDSTFKSVGGCDSIYRTMNITITPIAPLTKTIDTSSCSSIIFEGKTYSSSTVLDSTFKSIGGCDSIYRTVNISIVPIVPSTKIIDTSSCHSIVFEGKAYSSSTILDSTFKSIGGCDSIYRTVNISIVPIIPSTKTIDTSSCHSITFEGNTYSSSTVLNSTIMSVGSCDSIYRTVNISIVPITPSTKITDTSSCHSITFEGNTYSSSTVLNSTIMSVGGCDSIYRTVNISIVPVTPSTKIIAANGCSSTVFEGRTYTSSTILDSTIKSISGCDSIYRTVNITIITPTNKNININSCNSVMFEGKAYTSSIILDSTFKSAGGCDSIYRTVNITIVPIAPSFKIIDTSSCHSIVFEGKIYSSSTTLDSTFKSIGGCDSIYRTVHITINPIITTTKIIDTTGCGNVVFDGTTYTRSIVLNNTVKSIGGCDSVYNVTNITINDIPEISAGGPTVTVLGDGPVTLNGKILKNTGNDFTIVWTPDIAINDTGILNPTVSPVLEQHYVLTVTSGKCSASDGVDVIRTQNIVVPNIFSPNGDGINEVWDIKNIEQYASAKITVFNRYGQFVFESDGGYSNNPWNGTYNGQPLSIGTYFYIIKLSSSATPISGSVALVK